MRYTLILLFVLSLFATDAEARKPKRSIAERLDAIEQRLQAMESKTVQQSMPWKNWKLPSGKGIVDNYEPPEEDKHLYGKFDYDEANMKTPWEKMEFRKAGRIYRPSEWEVRSMIPAGD